MQLPPHRPEAVVASQSRDLRDWLTLIDAPRIGPRVCARLLEQFGDPGAVLGASTDRLARCGLAPETIAALRQPNQPRIDLSLQWAAQPDAHILTLFDSRYPPLLKEISDPPPLLYVRGDPLLLSEPQVAVVGSRNPTPGGREITHDLARQLTRFGLIITSGLAVGVDGVAHTAAMESGRTIAVLGTGPDLVYPATHRELAREIVQTGAMISELAPGQGPLARNFPRRNRIISGLSLGVLVTEAALKSGSLITARMALEQGREVFAVPGSIRNPLARGCHALIREGARLVESADDILAELSPQLHALIAAADVAVAPRSNQGVVVPLESDQQRLLDAMGLDALAPDELIGRTGLPAEQISAMLVLMELDGHVLSVPGGRYCRGRTAT